MEVSVISVARLDVWVDTVELCVVEKKVSGENVRNSTKTCMGERFRLRQSN